MLAITSLCPELGKKQSVIKPGICPSNMQQSTGKKLTIAVVGPAPYVITNKEKEWVGGAEFQIMDIYAKKFGFKPKFIMAPAAENKGGLVDMVWYRGFPLRN